METVRGRCCRVAVIAVFTLVLFGAPGPANADAGAAVFPGMEIRQGDAVCMVGFVETRLRVALTTGRCAGEPLVTDRGRRLVGAVLLARKTVDDADTAGALAPVEYEVIVLAPGVGATDLLPNGRHLREAPTLSARPGLRVCQLRLSAGQTCGAIGPVTNGRFTIAGPDDRRAVDRRDVGGPVYAPTDGGGAAVVGLVEGTRGSAPELESWQAVVRQLYIDCRAHGQPRPPSPVRMVGLVRAA